MKNRKVSTMDVLNWLGDDNWEKESMAYMIAEIANGSYKPEQLKRDIQDYEYREDE